MMVSEFDTVASLQVTYESQLMAFGHHRLYESHGNMDNIFPANLGTS